MVNRREGVAGEGYQIWGEDDVKYAVLRIYHYAKEQGFAEESSQELATSLSELGSNICKYAGEGRLWFGLCDPLNGVGMDIMAHDNGPGIIDLDKAMKDSYSSGGTLGLGLPGVKRMMDEFKIDSAPGQGTRVWGRKWR